MTCIGHKEGHISKVIHEEHIADKERSRHFKNVDKVLACENRETMRVLTMDLQQLLLCPKSFSSAVYYKRKLAVHNFTMFDLASKERYCYVWHKGKGELESDEFASLIVAHLGTLPDTFESVILWSDGCTYQNNYLLLNYLLQSCLSFKVGRNRVSKRFTQNFSLNDTHRRKMIQSMLPLKLPVER